jgi:hypothetical protein
MESSLSLFAGIAEVRRRKGRRAMSVEGCILGLINRFI